MIEDDDIIKEIRATREAFAAEYNYDVRAMIAALRAEDAGSGRVVVSFPPRPVTDINLGVKFDNSGEAELTDAQMAEVDRRLVAHRANPDAAIPWEQIEAEAVARLAK